MERKVTHINNPSPQLLALVKKMQEDKENFKKKVQENKETYFTRK